MNSSSDGPTPEAMIRATAASAEVAESKTAAMVRAASGAGRSARVTSVMTPSVPSDPTLSRPQRVAPPRLRVVVPVQPRRHRVVVLPGQPLGAPPAGPQVLAVGQHH